jgi:amino acid adenylation domain-containing protein
MYPFPYRPTKSGATNQHLSNLDHLSDEVLASLAIENSGQSKQMNNSSSNVPPSPPEQPIVQEHSFDKGLKAESFPLSFAQEGLWFLHQIEPGSPAYNISRLLKLRGELNVEALSWSLQRIIERHETLRTQFAICEEKPCQIVSLRVPLDFFVTDCSGASSAEAPSLVSGLARAEAERPFDLRRGPLLRARLLRLAATQHVLILCLHHIVCDGWSIEVLFAELEHLYNSACTGKEPALALLPIQYADYVLWQRERLQSEVLGKQLAYWRERLSGAATVLELPVDRLRPIAQTYRGRVEQRQLSIELSRGLQQLSQEKRATLFMVLLAAFQTLLWRYTGQNEIVVGTPMGNRQRQEVEGLIGLFVNTLALRSRIDGNDSFEDFLAQVKESCLSGYLHQELPFEKLVQDLQPERSLAYSPLFQVMLTMQDPARKELNLYQLETQLEVIHNAASKCDLSLHVSREHSQPLKLWLEYNAELFEPATIANWLLHYENLLEQIIAKPKGRLAELSLLSAGERRELLVERNRTERDFPVDQSVSELFEEQAEKTPDAPALRFEGEELSYRELNRRANQLAHYLREQGIREEERVGILMDRSLEMVVSLLGVLKAGGAYVPLDPQYPTVRLLTMVGDAKPKLILTQQRHWERLADGSIPKLCMDEESELLQGYSQENLPCAVGPENAVYIIYTSGSTGKPKGVVNTHGGVCNRLQWMQAAYPLDRDDRVLQKTPFSFDVSVWEFFLPLINGACLVVAKPGGHQDAEYLRDLIVEERITTIHFVPSMLGVFLEAKGVEGCVSLKRVICSGEALPYEMQERFFQRLEAELHNLYGPTEAAVDVTYWKCEVHDARRTVPIGRPIANIQVYVLDERMEPVPVGVKGELYLGGVGLARGYWRQAGMTAERFVPNPFSSEAGKRLYRTGDVVRYLGDGALEFRGRIDSQVKVRGNRIELGEIEGALRGHEEVREAVVIVREQEKGVQLIGYVVMNGGGGEEKIGELRSYLRQRLPEYMVPGAIVRLEELPLTSNGKLDRRALPDPETNLADRMSFVAPRGQTEQELAKIWSELLEISPISVQDNFFDLGGHSLLATQLASRILRTFGVELKLQDVFNAPTVGEIASLIDSVLIQTSDDPGIDEALGMLEQLTDDEVPGMMRDHRA